MIFRFISQLVLVFSLCFATAAAQPSLLPERDSSYREGSQPVYYVNPWMSGSIAAVGTFSNSSGLKRIQGKELLSPAELLQLDPSGIWAFDRWGLRQDPLRRERAAAVSDRIFQASVLLPLTLFLDKDIRQHWLPIALMYLETQSIASNFYSFSPLGPKFIDRYRPMAYYEALDEDTRIVGNNRNAFFSGHVSSVAAGTFFFVKVYSDYHPDFLGGKKWLAYSLAAVPPAITAIYRVKALKHWPSDTIVGGLVGGGFAVLVPELHKLWQRKRNSRLLLSGRYNEQMKGLAMQLTF